MQLQREEEMIEKLMVFSGGGLLCFFEFQEDKLFAMTSWDEGVSLYAMRVLAMLMRKSQEEGKKALTHKNWVIYIADSNPYILVAKIKSRRYSPSTLGMLRKLSLFISDVPESVPLVVKRIIRFLREKQKMRIEKIYVV